MTSKALTGVTLLELVVVLLILSLLATIAVGVYTGQVRRAEYAVARTEVRQLELNAARYEVDLGEFPLSSSVVPAGFPAVSVITNANFGGTTYGCGLLYLCLQHSLSLDALRPASPRWHGPYMEIQMDHLGEVLGGPAKQSTPVWSRWILDPWGNPYYYVRSEDYAFFNATQQNPAGVASVFGETYYNPSTVQIFSLGPNGTTARAPYAGLDMDDINNFDNSTRVPAAEPAAAGPASALRHSYMRLR